MALLFIWIVSVVVSAMLLSPYDKAGTGFVLGFLLGPLGAVIALVMRSNAAAEYEKRQRVEDLLARARDVSAAAEETKKCPFCAETVKAEAIYCRHCHKDLPQPGAAGGSGGAS